MQKINIKIKKLRENANIPTYGTEFSAGADLYAVLEEKIEIAPGETKFIPTGLAMEMPNGVVGLVYARSGLSCKKGLAPANKVGVIDSDYRGEIMVALHNHGNVTQTVENSDRIAQMVFAPYFSANFEELDVLQDSVRGEGVFGSTGKN